MKDMRWTIVLLVPILLLAAIAVRSQAQLQMVLVDLEGHRTRVGSVPASIFAPRVSPDGREVLFDTQDDGQLWIAKLSDVTSKRRLSTGASNRGPLWSGDGK